MDSLESILKVKTRTVMPSEQPLVCKHAMCDGNLIKRKLTVNRPCLTCMRWCQDEGADDVEEGDKPKMPKKKNKKKKKTMRRCIGKKPAAKPSSEPSSKPASQPGCLYKPGEFRDIRLKFIADLRQAEDVTWSEACKRWNTSERRAKLLEGMSYGQLKKRRF